MTQKSICSLRNSIFGGCVIDDDYVDGVDKTLAYDLSIKASMPIDVLGLEDRSAGFGHGLDNLPPSKESLIKFILERIKK
jgi:hypothetical protein